MEKKLALFIQAVLAGVCIGLGGTVFLQVKGLFPGANIVGALMFAIGLFTICTRGYALYTGKACYIFDNPPSYLLDLVIIWVGNLLGCIFLGAVENATVICGAKGINMVATGMVNAKLASSCLSLFLLGFVCNIFIYIAVNGYAKNPHELGKYLALLFGVSCFIVAGTEHSIADMYYFCVSNVIYAKPGESLVALIIISIGNLVGGVSFPVLEKFINKYK